ncbi:MAG: type II toxin-antitoxin system HicA family toxin [Dehalococcoidia bacterium]|nr:type II toxin-antitoxin system HicA family toxin [Dehalococcoidia bacterium]
MRYREAARKLRRLGCQEAPRKTRGSHRTWFNPDDTGQKAALPDQGSRDLRIGTLRSAIRDLGLDWQEFLDA